MTTEVKILTGIGVTVILLAIGLFFISGSSKQDNSSSAPQLADQNLLVSQNSHQTASSSAKITLVEFGDYQCPACGQAHLILKRILSDYQGQVNLVFRNFPLPMHKNAVIVAQAAEAAAAQGKFWPMHDWLYENQDLWENSSDAARIFTDYAKQLNLDVAKFSQDLSENKYQDTIKKDHADGNSLGVNATPTFYFNGEKISGVPSYAALKQKIDQIINTK